MSQNEPTRLQQVGTTNNHRIMISCADCDRRTAHVVLASAFERTTEAVQSNTDYQIVRCQGCGEISFRECWWLGADNRGDNEWLYPGRRPGRRGIDERYLPGRLRDLYMETNNAIVNEMPTLTAAGIRALVEGVCRNKLKSKKRLELAIDDLHAKGWLTKDGAETLHRTRIFGNAAVHELKRVRDETLDAAMDVVEHLLVGVYVLPRSAKPLLPPRRKRRP